MSNNNNKGGIFGKGYYIALILCAAAIGISGYVYYRNTNETESQLQAAVSQQVDAVPQEEDVAVVVIQPQPTQGETEKSDVTKPTLPAQPKTALKTGAPVAGQTVSDYAMDCLSYNETTRDWRVHNGVDIAAEAGAEVYAAADGTVSRVYRDHLLGNTVEITHADGAVSCYSNLANGVSVSEGDAVNAGALIGTVGDTSLTELADEPHLHFEIKVNGVSVNPLDYISEESKSASLGITDL